jgi:hypothetical protein
VHNRAQPAPSVPVGSGPDALARTPQRATSTANDPLNAGRQECERRRPSEQCVMPRSLRRAAAAASAPLSALLERSCGRTGTWRGPGSIVFLSRQPRPHWPARLLADRTTPVEWLSSGSGWRRSRVPELQDRLAHAVASSAYSYCYSCLAKRPAATDKDVRESPDVAPRKSFRLSCGGSRWCPRSLPAWRGMGRSSSPQRLRHPGPRTSAQRGSSTS